MKKCDVYIWDKFVGQLLFLEDNIYFKYAENFDLQISPIKMPLSRGQYSFKNLDYQYNLPGVFYESLPDKFGMEVMDDYFFQANLSEEPTVIDKLLFVGDVALGALSYKPSYEVKNNENILFLGAKELQNKAKSLASEARYSASELMEVYKSFSPAGGARAKAIVGYNKESEMFCLGSKYEKQQFVPSIIKFDERIFGKTNNFTINEFVMMSTASHVGISTPNFHLCKDENYIHFVIERFDIDKNGELLHKVSMSSLNDYNFLDKSFGYEHIFRSMEKLQLSKSDFEEMFRRMVFNFVYNNHDDHLKNHAFLMNKKGEWSLAPAYDLTYIKSAGNMSNFLRINGKKSKDVNENDFIEIALRHGIKNYSTIIKEVEEGVKYFANQISKFLGDNNEAEFMLSGVNFLTDKSKDVMQTVNSQIVKKNLK